MTEPTGVVLETTRGERHNALLNCLGKLDGVISWGPDAPRLLIEWLPKLLRDFAKLEEEVGRLRAALAKREARLEIDHAFKLGDGPDGFVRFEIPPDQRDHFPDKITALEIDLDHAREQIDTARDDEAGKIEAWHRSEQRRYQSDANRLTTAESFDAADMASAKATAHQLAADSIKSRAYRTDSGRRLLSEGK